MSIDNHIETRSVNKANTTTTATFLRQMYKRIVGACQLFCHVIVVFTSVQPCFGDGYKIHLYHIHVIRKNIGLVAKLMSVDKAQCDRYRDTGARTLVIRRRHGEHNTVDSRFAVIHRW